MQGSCRLPADFPYAPFPDILVITHSVLLQNEFHIDVLINFKVPVTGAKAMKDIKWDTLIAARVYCIVMFIALPVAHVSNQLGRIQPGGAVILGIAAWLVLKFAFFETRTASGRFLAVSLWLLLPASAAIFINFVIGLLINTAHGNTAGLFFTTAVIATTPLYFAGMIAFRPFRGVNTLASASAGGGFFEKHLPEALLALWIAASIVILAFPYTTYSHRPAAAAASQETPRLGFWTGKRFFDEETAGPGRYVTDGMLVMFGRNGVYLVYSGIKVEDGRLDERVIEDFIRCRENGVEINIAFSAMMEDYSFINIWTFEHVSARIEKALSVLDGRGLLGNPVTALVYDMEAPEGKFFPHYGYDQEVRAKLPEYYEVQEKFREFNRRIMEKYGIRVRICAETSQAFDPRDGDDDLAALYGVMSDDRADMSYMIYRRDNYKENYVADSAGYLRKGDTLILNTWKEEGYQCRGDLDCAINEARIAAGHPGKNHGVEVWALCYFLDSFGEKGLFEFVGALSSDMTAWPPAEVRNSWPRSVLWDLAITAISALDIYAPLFRAFFHAY